MIHTSISQNCTIYFFCCELILFTKWPTRFLHDVRGKHAISRHVCVDHYILLLNYPSNHLQCTTKGFKRFSKTNSTDSIKATCSFNDLLIDFKQAWVTSEIIYLTSRASNSNNLGTSCDYYFIPKMQCSIMFGAGVIVKLMLKDIFSVTDV